VQQDPDPAANQPHRACVRPGGHGCRASV
jgi:hypothetical protein